MSYSCRREKALLYFVPQNLDPPPIKKINMKKKHYKYMKQEMINIKAEYINIRNALYDAKYTCC